MRFSSGSAQPPAFESSPEPQNNSPITSWWVFVLIGLAGGFLAGLFGVGGGVIMVPALTIFAKFTQRQAAGTSLAAILPAAAVASVSYVINGDVDWLAALVLAVGMVLGTQVGTYLLNRISQGGLVFGFAGFQVLLIISLFLVIPERDDVMQWNVVSILLLSLVGLFTGVLAGLLGVGGGIVVVPVLMVFFGASDLVAKGTSLIMMIPGSLSGTLANVKRGNINLRAALYVALGAVVIAPVGALAANAIDPHLGNVLFAILIAVLATRMVVTQLRRQRQ